LSLPPFSSNFRQSRYSALKVVKSASRYAETARDEIKLLTKVAEANPAHPGRSHVVSFLDSFTHPGPEDFHVCIIFEPLGENLLALIERNKKKGVPRPLVKVIATQILLGLQYLHDECDLVHTDIKPENIRTYSDHSPITYFIQLLLLFQ
jgi:serine/threonine-protein kinase SRPK3